METVARGNTSSNSSIGNKAENAFDKATSRAHAAVTSLAGAADDAASKAKPAIDKVATMAHQAVDKAAGAAAPTAEWLASQAETLDATQKKLVADACNYISANPLKAVGIALAAGFVLSRALR